MIRKIEDRELRKEIHDAINELPDKCKEVFKLSYLLIFHVVQIADVLGVSLRTVEAHMYKACLLYTSEAWRVQSFAVQQYAFDVFVAFGVVLHHDAECLFTGEIEMCIRDSSLVAGRYCRSPRVVSAKNGRAKCH